MWWKKKIINILKDNNVYDFEVENKSIEEVIDILSDCLYDLGNETCSYDVCMYDNYIIAIKELKKLKIGE